VAVAAVAVRIKTFQQVQAVLAAAVAVVPF
jgi:hypothetical protein